MCVLSMKDLYGQGHVIYYYKGSDVYMYVIYPFYLGEDGNRKCAWTSFEEIEKKFRAMTFSRHSLKWARLRGIDI